MSEKNILQQLYDGNIVLSADIGVNNPELQTANTLAEDAQIRFAKNLVDSDREEFNKVYDLYDRASQIYYYECFAYGFRLGVTLLHEALSGVDVLSKHGT